MKRNRAYLVLASTAIGAVFAVGCEPSDSGQPPATNDGDLTAPSETPAPAPAAESVSYSGRLKGGMAGIGGEHTGWMLTGTEIGDIEIDVAAIADLAGTLDGARVTVTGKMVERNYVERGPTPVLEAQSIERAN